MIRSISRPSTAHCTLSMYVAFLLSEPNAPSCCRLAQLMGISHDSVNRFLEREGYTPAELFLEVKAGLNLKGGTLRYPSLRRKLSEFTSSSHLTKSMFSWFSLRRKHLLFG